MFYSIYFVLLVIFLLGAMTVTVSMFPALSISISISNIINFLDVYAMIFVIGVCLVSLACTKSLKPLKDAFLSMFKKRDDALLLLEERLLSVKVAVLSAFFGGGVSFTANIVNMLKGMDLSGGVAYVGIHAGSALLSLGYSLVIALIFLPVYVALRQDISRKNCSDGAPRVISVHKKKAG